MSDRAGPAVELTNVEDVYPLAPLQRGLLFHSLAAPGTGAYVEQVAWTVDGELDPAVFAAAWQRAVDRHPALRTVFFWQGLERPLQVVRRRVTVAVAERDATAAADPGRVVAELAAAERHRGFDLTQAPLMRLVHARLPAGRHRLLWTYHHLLLDGWSVGRLLAEVFRSYGAIRRGLAAPAAPAPPYRAYVDWVGARDRVAAEAHWRRELAGFDEPTPLGDGLETAPSANQPAPAAPRRYGLRQRHLPPGVAAELAARARQFRVTPHTLVAAAWALLLGRYGGRRDVLFGSVVSGRPPTLAGVEEIIGLLINTLPLRVRLDPAASVGSFLRRLQERQLESRPYEHSPLTEIQRWSEIPAGRPLFESLVAFDNTPLDRALFAAGDGARIRQVERSPSRTGQGLSLEAALEPRLTLRLAYDGERFGGAWASRLLGHLGELLRGLASGEGVRLGELSLLTAAERQQLVVEWGGAGGSVAGLPAGEDPGTLVAAFAAQAARRGESVAVVGGDEQWSYGGLGRWSRRLASRLAGRGVGPEVRVGLSADRAPSLVAAILGILEAGGAYVPLEPDDPAPRRLALLADCGAPLLLAGGTAAAGLAAPPGLERVDLEGAEAEPEPGTPPPAGPLPASTAYVIYTSGSTGKPKGVAVPHAAAAAYVSGEAAALGIGPGERYLQLSSPAFDASVLEIFVTLTGGATLVLRDAAMLASPAAFFAGCRRRAVTAASLTTALWHELTAGLAGEPGPPPALRLLTFGGEAAQARHLAAWRRWSGGRVRLINAYGPTETTVVAVRWDAGRGAVPRATGGAAGVPIGRPIPGARAHVLSPWGRPLPPGVAGELWIGGAGVARGYLGHPGLTADRFRPDPFTATPGSRLYRTGDRVSWLPAGELVFLGRLDRQLKIRGFRVEPGEVEAALAAHPGVGEAMVLALEAAGEGTRLAAYYVPASPPGPSPAALRRWLARRLPAALVPAYLVEVPALPRTAAGKLDRRALPRPDRERLLPEQGAVAPRTETERLLAGLWAEVLGVGRVGVDDDFFALGGDSLRSLRIAARARERGLELSPAQIFEAPTVARLAAVLAAPAARAEAPPPPAPEDPAAAGFPDAGLSPGDLERLLRKLAAEERGG